MDSHVEQRWSSRQSCKVPVTLVVCRGETVLGRAKGTLENVSDQGGCLRQESLDMTIRAGDCVYLDARAEGEGLHPRFQAAGTVRWTSLRDQPRAGLSFVSRSRISSDS